jgi:hypothetical protein
MFQEVFLRMSMGRGKDEDHMFAVVQHNQYLQAFGRRAAAILATFPGTGIIIPVAAGEGHEPGQNCQ